MEEENKIINGVKYEFIRPLEGENSTEYIQRIIDTRGKYNIPNNWYYENHHIIPRCMGGEPQKWNHKTKHDNLIWLLPEEHFCVHTLTCIENPGNWDLIKAWNMLRNSWSNKKWIAGDILLDLFDAEEYGQLRRQYIESISGENNPFYGVHLRGPDNPNYGRHLSEETKQKMARHAHERYQGEGNPNYGKHWSEEHNKKASERRKGQFVYEDNPRALACVCVETGEIFLSCKEAFEKKGASARVRYCCRDGKTSGGYHWRYATPDEIQQEKERREKENE